MNSTIKQEKRARRHKRIRSTISGTAERPRFSVFKSNTGLYAQLIDDVRGVTLAAAKGKAAGGVGSEIAKKAAAVGIVAVVFDRGGYLYAGKIKALADAAREAGLKF